MEAELAGDEALLRSVEDGGPAAFRTWRAPATTVVVGRGVTIGEEVDEAFCATARIPIVRRSSGGRSVLVGAGTLQYAFALPYTTSEALATIGGAKQLCNALLLAGLSLAGPSGAATLRADESGDLVRGDRKVAGLALRRRRSAMLLHGTILIDADLALIARALKHPAREPAYRRGREHGEFLANLGTVDEEVLAGTVAALLAGVATSPSR